MPIKSLGLVSDLKEIETSHVKQWTAERMNNLARVFEEISMTFAEPEVAESKFRSLPILAGYSRTFPRPYVKVAVYTRRAGNGSFTRPTEIFSTSEHSGNKGANWIMKIFHQRLKGVV